MKKYFLIIFVFLQVTIVFGQYDSTLIPYRLKDKWGYCNVNGNIKIKPIFEEAQLFNNVGYAIVKKRGKYGIINKEGKYTCTPKFKKLENFEYEDVNYGKFKATNFNNLCFNINSNGEKVYLLGRFIVDWRCGGVLGSNHENYIMKDKESFENRVIPKNIFYLNYLNIKYNEDDYFYFTINKDTFIYLNKGKDRSSTGILSNKLNAIVPFKYQRIEEYERLFKVLPEGNQNNYFGLYSTYGKELFAPYKIMNLNDSLLLLKNDYLKFGIFNLNKLAIVLPVEYDKIILLKANNEITFLVSNNRIDNTSLDFNNFKNYRLINEYNVQIFDNIYNEIILINNLNSSYFIAKTSHGWNKFNLNGNTMFKESYKSLIYLKKDSNYIKFKEDVFIVSKFNSKGNEKYGLINIDDSILVPFEFDLLIKCPYKFENQGFFKMLDFKNTMFLAKKDNNCGLISLENQIILPLKYKNIELLEYSPFAFVELENGKTGYVNYITGMEYFKD